jgi:hypothetical protein
VSPSERARSPLVTTTAAAPSLVCDELPAVTVPRTWNAGFSFASASSDVSRRGPSSVSKVMVWFGTTSGTISSLNRPASIAAIALRWLSSANASCSSRETDASRAWFSPTSPVVR